MEQIEDILDVANKIDITEAIPRKPSIQRNLSNISSSIPVDHYKKGVVVLLLDSLIIQTQD